MTDCLSPQRTNLEIKNLKNGQNALRPNIRKNVKLKPLKNHSAFIDPQRNRKIMTESKRRNAGNANDDSYNQNVEESCEERKYNPRSPLHGSVASSKQSKRNRRYSNTECVTASLADTDFKIIDDTNEINLYDQLNRSIVGADVDENNRLYIQGSNGRKISIIGLKSPVRNSKCMHKDSEDRQTFQNSTYCSNTINKSSKKSGFKLSYDFFSFGDDEVNQERTNKNRDVLNLLSESDFEQIKQAIANDYQKGSKEMVKASQRRPFSCCVEDPKAEDKDSD